MNLNDQGAAGRTGPQRQHSKTGFWREWKVHHPTHYLDPRTWEETSEGGGWAELFQCEFQGDSPVIREEWLSNLPPEVDDGDAGCS